MNSASVNQSTDSWTDISGDKYVIIGGDAQTVVTAFVSDANAMKAYKDNAVDAATANDGVTYRLAVVTNGNAATVAAPAAPASAPEGKEFAGWRGFEGTAPNLTEKIYQPGDSISVSENTSLNAVWKLQTPSIKLNLNGGIGVSDHENGGATFGRRSLSIGAL